jgi:hypothetical protein
LGLEVLFQLVQASEFDFHAQHPLLFALEGLHDFFESLVHVLNHFRFLFEKAQVGFFQLCGKTSQLRAECLQFVGALLPSALSHVLAVLMQVSQCLLVSPLVFLERIYGREKAAQLH